MDVVITIPMERVNQCLLDINKYLRDDGPDFMAQFKPRLEDFAMSEMRQWCIDNNCRCTGDDYSFEKIAIAGTTQHPTLTGADDVRITFSFASDADALFFKMRWFGQ